MREGRWKVIYFYNARRWELYDLDTDISETHNLAESEPARLSKLAGTLQAEMSRLDAQWPVDRKTGEPEPLQMPPAK
jgi:arylsulfatase A-like enzyme